jgi:hypothetical protein
MHPRCLLVTALSASIACTPAGPPATPEIAAPVAPTPQDDAQRRRLGELLNPVQKEPESRAPVEPDPSIWLSEADAERPDASLWAGVAPRRARAPVKPSAADEAAIARLLCESPVTRRGKGFHCAKCPSYAELAGLEAGMDLTAFFPGHFSGPGRDEVLVATSGCESGASSSQSYGARVLVQKTPGGWERTFYRPGALGQCTPLLSRTGRSRLFCQRRAGHMGEYPLTWSLVGFAEIAGEIEARDDLILAFVTRDVPYLRGFTKAPLHLLELVGHELVGKAKYEAGDERALALEVTLRSRVDCVGGPSGCPSVDTSPYEAKLRVVFDGSTFRLAPESRPAFDRLRSRDLRLPHG